MTLYAQLADENTRVVNIIEAESIEDVEEALGKGLSIVEVPLDNGRPIYGVGCQLYGDVWLNPNIPGFVDPTTTEV